MCVNSTYKFQKKSSKHLHGSQKTYTFALAFGKTAAPWPKGLWGLAVAKTESTSDTWKDYIKQKLCSSTRSFRRTHILMYVSAGKGRKKRTIDSFIKRYFYKPNSRNQVILLTDKQINWDTLQWRVWSWLRMNASYRLNTCKSRGSVYRCLHQYDGDRRTGE